MYPYSTASSPHWNLSGIWQATKREDQAFALRSAYEAEVSHFYSANPVQVPGKQRMRQPHFQDVVAAFSAGEDYIANRIALCNTNHGLIHHSFSPHVPHTGPLRPDRSDEAYRGGTFGVAKKREGRSAGWRVNLFTSSRIDGSRIDKYFVRGSTPMGARIILEHADELIARDRFGGPMSR
jgi:hypothetical protein